MDLYSRTVLSLAQSFDVGSLTNAIEIEPSAYFWLEPNLAIFMMSGEIDTEVT